MKIVVAGAGIIGVTIAHALLDGGHQVTLIDRAGFGAEASGRNAGWIAHADILPLASPKAWANLPRWLLDPLGPLSLRPAYLPQLLPWLWRFWAASNRIAVEASTVTIALLNGAALPAWERRLGALGLDHHLRRRGQLSIWSDRAAFAGFSHLARRQQALGIAVEPLEARQISQLEPAFAAAVQAGRIVGGAIYGGVPHVGDPLTLTEALGRRAIERGARLVSGDVVGFAASPGGQGVHVLTGDGTALAADRAVLALGAWSKAAARTAGDRVPLDTERGYNITMAPGTLGLTRPVMYEGHGFVSSPLDSGDRLGGAVEFAGLDAAPNYARVDAFLNKARQFLPHLGPADGVRRLCFRPSIPDSLPVIGPARHLPAVIHAFGHGHYGLTQAAITAELVAALIDGRPTALPLAPFSPQRF